MILSGISQVSLIIYNNYLICLFILGSNENKGPHGTVDKPGPDEHQAGELPGRHHRLWLGTQGM